MGLKLRLTTSLCLAGVDFRGERSFEEKARGKSMDLTYQCKLPGIFQYRVKQIATRRSGGWSRLNLQALRPKYETVAITGGGSRYTAALVQSYILALFQVRR